jgi:hypothetical protein
VPQANGHSCAQESGQAAFRLLLGPLCSLRQAHCASSTPASFFYLAWRHVGQRFLMTPSCVCVWVCTPIALESSVAKPATFGTCAPYFELCRRGGGGAVAHMWRPHPAHAPSMHLSFHSRPLPFFPPPSPSADRMFPLSQRFTGRLSVRRLPLTAPQLRRQTWAQHTHTHTVSPRVLLSSGEKGKGPAPLGNLASLSPPRAAHHSALRPLLCPLLCPPPPHTTLTAR